MRVCVHALLFDVYTCTYTMVVKFDHAIENQIDKISTQTCFYAFHVVFTYRANIMIQVLHFACYSCFTLHVHLHILIYMV